jgi:hypothetical protein
MVPQDLLNKARYEATLRETPEPPAPVPVKSQSPVQSQAVVQAAVQSQAPVQHETAKKVKKGKKAVTLDDVLNGE